MRASTGRSPSIRRQRDPAPPAPSGQARLYVKDGRLVVQWNDGGTTLYTTTTSRDAGAVPCVLRGHHRHRRALTETEPDREQPAVTAVPESFTLELTLEEMGFLRLLLTNASIQPAELKKLCGEVQAKVEAHIGPLPPG